jgi:phosphatidylglycerol:prolipoprotein diacylglycerol transferase
MFPSFELFGRAIGLYPVMALCGIFSAGIYVCGITKNKGHDDNEAIVFLLLISAGVFLGSHILYALVNYENILYMVKNREKINSLQKAYNAYMYVFGGSVFYGGLIGGTVTAFFCVRKKNNWGYLIDIITPSIPLFHFFGRIGCFLGGCCYGIESVFGFTYTRAVIDSANTVKRFPVQLLEALFNIVLFFVLEQLRRKDRFRNKLFYIYVIVYATGRFFIEFLRGDDLRGKWPVLSTSQIISIVVLVFSLLMKRMTPGNPAFSLRDRGALSP